MATKAILRRYWKRHAFCTREERAAKGHHRFGEGSELFASESDEPVHKAGDVVEARIDPDLIAGIKITVNDEMQFDGSLKSKLNKVLGAV